MRYPYVITIVIFLLSLTACKKVIELKIKDSDIKTVIEGVVTNEPGVCKVFLSQSRPFYDDNQFATISSAQVTVSDNGQPFALSETSPGVYETQLINGTPGHMYQLNVQVGNQHFTASCIMPQSVSLDTLYVAPGPLGQFKFATIGYTDPPVAGNFYRFVQFLNGVKDPALFFDKDEFTNGQTVLRQLDTGVDKKTDPRNIDTGDTVTVEMQCIDKAMYEYWYSLRTGGGQGGGSNAAPANPITNITGGALGYFSAHTVSRLTVIAP